MARLAAGVWVGGVFYAPGSDVPADVAKQITNPSAWEAGPDKDSSNVESEKTPAKKSASKKTAAKS